MTSRNFEAARFARFVWRRMRANAGLLGAFALGVLIATTVLAGAPTYVRSLERVGVAHTVDRLGTALQSVSVTNRRMPFTQTAFEAGSAVVREAALSLSGLAIGDGNLVSTPRILWGPAEEGVRQGPGVPLAVLQRMAHLDANVSYVAGGPPSEVVNFQGEFPVAEVAIAAKRAAEKGVSVGDVLEVAPSTSEYGRLLAVVTGLIEPLDISSAFWGGFGTPVLLPDSLDPDKRPPPLAMFLRGDAIWEVTAESQIAVGTGKWFVYLDQDALRRSLTGNVIGRIDAFRAQIRKQMPRAQVLGGPDSAFRSLQRRALFSRVPTYLMGALLVSVAAYYLLMIAGLMAERRRSDLGMLRSRGLGAAQIARLHVLEAGPLIAAAVIAAPFAARLIVSQVGRLGAYRAITGGETLPTDLSWTPFAFSAATGVAAAALLLAPALMHGRGNIVAEKRAAARPSRPPFFQRYFLDAVALALGGLILWELRTRQTLVVTDLGGEQATDISALFGPALLLVAAALVFLRVFPPVLSVAAWLMGRRFPVWLTMAVWRLARSPHQYAWPILLFALASGLGVLSASLAATLELSAHERIAYATASDIRLTKVRAIGGAHGETLARLRAIPGVSGASIALRGNGRFGTTDSGLRFRTLSVDPVEFGKVSWFREDFAKLPLKPLLKSIYVPDRAPPVPLPARARRISIWARSDQPVANLFLWVVVRGADGRANTITLGPIHGGDWRRQTALVPERVVGPAELVSILVFEPVGGDSGSAATIYLDDLEVEYVDAEGNPARSVVAPFESREGWAVLPGSEGLDAVFTIEPDPAGRGAREGLSVGRLVLGRGTDSGVRGIYRAIAGDAIPVIASESFTAATGKGVGQTFVTRIFGVFAPLRIVNTVSFFPTLDPGYGGFLIADYGVMADYVHFRGESLSSGNDEVFISVDGSDEESVIPRIREVVNKLAVITGSAERARESLVDPLAVAGWRGMAIVAIAGTVLIAALGYLTYLVSYVTRGRIETAFLRALGMSPGVYIRMVALEHLAIAAAGLGLGTVLGLAMTRLAVDSVAHTATGGRLLPPFVLSTEWLPVGAIYAMLAFVAVVSAGYLIRSFRRLALGQITRVEE